MTPFNPKIMDIIDICFARSEFHPLELNLQYPIKEERQGFSKTLLHVAKCRSMVSSHSFWICWRSQMAQQWSSTPCSTTQHDAGEKRNSQVTEIQLIPFYTMIYNKKIIHVTYHSLFANKFCGMYKGNLCTCLNILCPTCAPGIAVNARGGYWVSQ